MAAVDDILRATLKGTIQASDIWNLVFHYVVITGSETNYATIAAAIDTALDTAFNALEANISTHIESFGLDLFEWDFVDNEWDGKAGVVSSALVGLEAGDRLPNGNSMVIRFVTEELRRQGRKFIPGITEVDSSNNTVSVSMLATLVTAMNLLNNDIVAGGATLRPCTFNDTPLSPRFETHSKFVSTAFANTFVGYQRRRQPGAGA